MFRGVHVWYIVEFFALKRALDDADAIEQSCGVSDFDFFPEVVFEFLSDE